jgi:hypothetical protein
MVLLGDGRIEMVQCRQFQVVFRQLLDEQGIPVAPLPDLLGDCRAESIPAAGRELCDQFRYGTAVQFGERLTRDIG